MPATQFKVTDEAGTYLCAVRTLVFEGSILVYNPARDEAEWVPAHCIANDLSWAEEKSAVVLANYVPRIYQEVAHIAGLGTRHLVSWPDNSSSEEEDDGQAEEEEDEWEEDPVDMEEQGEASPKPLSGGMRLEQGETEREAKPQRRQRSREWGSIMDDEEPLTFDDLQSDSDATIGGHSPVHSTPQEPGLPQETTVEVHARESEVEEL